MKGSPLKKQIIDNLQSLIKGLNAMIFASFDRYCTLHELDYEIASGKDKIANGNIPLFGSTGLLGKTTSPSFNEQLVLVARVGSIGNVQFVNIPCGVSDNAIVIRCGAKAKYVYYYLKSYNFKRITSGTTQPLITASDVRRIRIPIISEEKEIKIVEMLDSFNSKLDIESTILMNLLKQKEFLLSNMLI